MRLSLCRLSTSVSSPPVIKAATRPLLIKKSTLDQRPVRNIDQIVIKPSLHVSSRFKKKKKRIMVLVLSILLSVVKMVL